MKGGGGARLQWGKGKQASARRHLESEDLRKSSVCAVCASAKVTQTCNSRCACVRQHVQDAGFQPSSIATGLSFANVHERAPLSTLLHPSACDCTCWQLAQEKCRSVGPSVGVTEQLSVLALVLVAHDTKLRNHRASWRTLPHACGNCLVRNACGATACATGEWALHANN